MGFAEILSTAEPLADGFRIAIPENWHQGRAAYGRFSSALAGLQPVALFGSPCTRGHGTPPLGDANNLDDRL